MVFIFIMQNVVIKSENLFLLTMVSQGPSLTSSILRSPQ